MNINKVQLKGSVFRVDKPKSVDSWLASIAAARAAYVKKHGEEPDYIGLKDPKIAEQLVEEQSIRGVYRFSIGNVQAGHVMVGKKLKADSDDTEIVAYDEHSNTVIFRGYKILDVYPEDAFKLGANPTEETLQELLDLYDHDVIEPGKLSA